MRGDKKFREYESEEEVIADGEESIDGSHRSIETLKNDGSEAEAEVMPSIRCDAAKFGTYTAKVALADKSETERK